MVRCLNGLLAAVIAASLLAPAIADARQVYRKYPRIVIHPHYSAKTNGRYGFLPGYRQPPYIAEWRDRSPRYGGPHPRSELRFWEDGAWRYGWGGPGFYRGQWNGGSFGPCWTQTPIGPMWNCGR
jgi:hypothetical protein